MGDVGPLAQPPIESFIPDKLLNQFWGISLVNIELLHQLRNQDRPHQAVEAAGDPGRFELVVLFGDDLLVEQVGADVVDPLGHELPRVHQGKLKLHGHLLDVHAPLGLELLAEDLDQRVQIPLAHHLIVDSLQPVPVRHDAQPRLDYVCVQAHDGGEVAHTHPPSFLHRLVDQLIQVLLGYVFVPVRGLVEHQPEVRQLQQKLHQGPVAQGVRLGLLDFHELLLQLPQFVHFANDIRIMSTQSNMNKAIMAGHIFSPRQFASLSTDSPQNDACSVTFS